MQKNIDAVKKAVSDNRRVTVKENEEALDINHKRVLFILHKKLGLSKVIAQWVPRLLTNDQKQNRATLSMALFN